MTYLLDTNAAIALLNGRPPAVRERFRQVSLSNAVLLSAIALFELWYGVARSARPQENAERLRAFLAGTVDVAGFDEEDAARSGEIRHSLAGNGTPIGPYDLLIAAQALRLGATLVTANVREFTRVPGLVWDDWTAPERA